MGRKDDEVLLSRRDFFKIFGLTLAVALGRSKNVPSDEPPPSKDFGCTPVELGEEAIDFLARHEVSRGDRSRPVVLMTYDDQGRHERLGWILDAYKNLGGKATFFFHGGYYREGITLSRYAAEIERIVEEGHIFACHCLVHEDLRTYEEGQVRQDIENWLSIAQEIVPGYSVKYLRFPGGDRNDALKRVVASYGLQSVMWSVESGGVDENTFNYVVDRVFPGSIVLSHMHRYYDAAYAERIVARLLEDGYSLETPETGLDPFDQLPESLRPRTCPQEPLVSIKRLQKY